VRGDTRYPADLDPLLIDDPDDPHGLAARLRHWLGHRDRFAAAAAALSERLRAYTWDDMAARFVAVAGLSP
jgi:hypothetical protein